MLVVDKKTVAGRHYGNGRTSTNGTGCWAMVVVAERAIISVTPSWYSCSRLLAACRGIKLRRVTPRRVAPALRTTLPRQRLRGVVPLSLFFCCVAPRGVAVRPPAAASLPPRAPRLGASVPSRGFWRCILAPRGYGGPFCPPNAILALWASLSLAALESNLSIKRGRLDLIA
jgi:hypothetical protein